MWMRKRISRFHPFRHIFSFTRYADRSACCVLCVASSYILDSELSCFAFKTENSERKYCFDVRFPHEAVVGRCALQRSHTHDIHDMPACWMENESTTAPTPMNWRKGDGESRHTKKIETRCSIQSTFALLSMPRIMAFQYTEDIWMGDDTKRAYSNGAYVCRSLRLRCIDVNACSRMNVEQTQNNNTPNRPTSYIGQDDQQFSFLLHLFLFLLFASNFVCIMYTGKESNFTKNVYLGAMYERPPTFYFRFFCEEEEEEGESPPFSPNIHSLFHWLAFSLGIVCTELCTRLI